MKAIAKTILFLLLLISYTSHADSERILAYELTGTINYCDVDVEGALMQSIKQINELGINYKAIDYLDFIVERKYKYAYLLQIVATSLDSKTCSLALVRTKTKLAPYNKKDTQDGPTTHNKPQILFVEPIHTSNKNSLIEAFSTALVIDHLYEENPAWLSNQNSEWTKEFYKNPNIILEMRHYIF